MTTTTHHPRARLPADVLLEVADVTKTFATTAGERPVLDGVSLRVHAGEIIALLGRSGSGKSTLLRAMAGLLAPSAGTVSFRGTPLQGPNPGTAMVFQTFALLPWLTVLQNVELGLEARGVSRAERRTRAEAAIDLIGLDGFESAYPKELSGGMRQRVGFARALVVEPEVLLMDEPFSALDVLTAENLRGELAELWQRPDLPTRAIVLVTHNIDEAVLLADRIVVLGTDPGRVAAELAVDLPRPRDRSGPAYADLVDRIYDVMTGRPHPSRPTEDPAGPATAVRATPTPTPPATATATSTATPLPHATVDGLSGLAEVLVGLGPTPIADVAEELTFEIDDLLPLVDALDLLGFATLDHGLLALTDEGRTFALADIQTSKERFARAVLDRAPLVRAIVHATDHGTGGTIGGGFFRQLLRGSFSAGETETQLDIATDWGRYAEQFAYDADHDEFVADPDRLGIRVDGEAVRP